MVGRQLSLAQAYCTLEKLTRASFSLISVACCMSGSEQQTAPPLPVEPVAVPSLTPPLSEAHILMALQWGAFNSLRQQIITPDRPALLAEAGTLSQHMHDVNASHVMLIGPKSDSGVVDDEDAKPFACDKCNKRFGTKSLMKRHRSIHEEKRHVSRLHA